MRGAAMWLGLCAMALGCSTAGNGAQSTEPAQPLAQAEPAPPAVEPSPQRPFVLGTPEGVFGLDDSGAVEREYSKTPASQPRFIPGTQDIVFFSEETRAIVRLSLETGKETRLAVVPEPAACGSDLGLAVQSYGDFVVDVSGARACLRLYDRNENMADVGVTARVDLTSGALRSRVSLGANCPVDEGADAVWNCQHPPRPEAVPVAAIDPARMPAGFELEARSPDGRWAVIAGNLSEGDYMHRDALLLDVDSGDVRVIARGPWPEPVPRAEVEAFRYETADIVGESTIEWLRDDLLHVDNLFVTPGESTIVVDGDLAR